MFSSTTRRTIALLAASLATCVAAGGAGASSPTVATWTVHVERPFTDCGGFGVVGIWEIGHKLTLFVDDSGTPIRDIERVDFSGRLVNSSTGQWVPDSGSRIFFDTLAPDGSFLTTFLNEVRHSKYVFGAGRTDFQTGSFHGNAAIDDAGIAALCEALGG
jgi:hypothetical protein